MEEALLQDIKRALLDDEICKTSRYEEVYQKVKDVQLPILGFDYHWKRDLDEALVLMYMQALRPYFMPLFKTKRDRAMAICAKLDERYTSTETEYRQRIEQERVRLNKLILKNQNNK